MRLLRRKVINVTAMVIGLAMAGLLFVILSNPGMSPVSSGMIIGVLGIMCLAGLGYGFWEARDRERRRKAKEDYWINH